MQNPYTTRCEVCKNSLLRCQCSSGPTLSPGSHTPCIVCGVPVDLPQNYLYALRALSEITEATTKKDMKSLAVKTLSVLKHG